MKRGLRLLSVHVHEQHPSLNLLNAEPNLFTKKREDRARSLDFYQIGHILMLPFLLSVFSRVALGNLSGNMPASSYRIKSLPNFKSLFEFCKELGRTIP